MQIEASLLLIEEQIIITEVTSLEGKLSKARQVKQGMMSVLLTGKVRLVESG